jgi:cytochrome c biogenesis protein CcmG/thiol:disulfide interchange protein DsbE
VLHNANPTLRGRRSGILSGVCFRLARPLAVLATGLAASALAACGGGGSPATGGVTSTTSATGKRNAAARLAAAPVALRANAADADTIAGEGTGALEARLATLRGHPVVVNQWASWCGPCRHEFPFFADAVVEHGARVAFVGIDFTDDRDAANAFLRESPPGFASIYDPKGDAARWLGGGRIAPTTFFIGRDGERRYTKLGGYANAAALEADIRRYAA